MLQDAHTELDSEVEAPLITLGQLLREGIPVRKLANAIERYGIYTLDRFGRLFNIYVGDDVERALSLLEKQHKWEMDPGSPIRSDRQPPLELRSGEYDDPYEDFGWPANLLPNFDNTYQIQPEGTLVEKVSRKAPDAFMAALVRLAVRLASRDPDINIEELPGTKADLQRMADEFDDDLKCKPSTFWTYIKPFFKFKPGSRRTNYYRERHPDCHKREDSSKPSQR